MSTHKRPCLNIKVVLWPPCVLDGACTHKCTRACSHAHACVHTDRNRAEEMALWIKYLPFRHEEQSFGSPWKPGRASHHSRGRNKVLRIRGGKFTFYETTLSSKSINWRAIMDINFRPQHMQAPPLAHTCTPTHMQTCLHTHMQICTWQKL